MTFKSYDEMSPDQQAAWQLGYEAAKQEFLSDRILTKILSTASMSLGKWDAILERVRREVVGELRA